MSKETPKRYRRGETARNLLTAAKLLREAAQKFIKAADVLAKMDEVQSRVKEAVRVAGPTTLSTGKTVRDGLPYGIRQKIQTEVSHIERLAQQVREAPITKEERSLKEKALRSRRITSRQ